MDMQGNMWICLKESRKGSFFYVKKLKFYLNIADEIDYIY